MSLAVRTAKRDDAATILDLIRELAAFEKLLDSVKASVEDLQETGFGERAYFECLLAEWDGAAVGFALFFHNFSTFEGQPGLYLEDLFVKPELRGKGIGKALLARLAALARDRGCARLDLSVLHWNPARAFYEKLGIAQQTDWLPYRLEGDNLAALAAEDRG